MKQILTSEEFDVPAGVKVDVKSREVTVKGPLGVLKRSFKHASADIFKKKNDKGSKVHVQMWFGARKQKCAVTSIATHIKNMIRGVTQGYKFKMRYAYAHFPIQANILTGGKAIEIKNFIGERLVRKIDCKEGVTITRKEEEKDQIWIQGTSLENTSQTCSLINQSVRVRNKDIRQFLDGIYVSDKRLPI